MGISLELFLDHLNAKLIGSWFPGRSANFNLVSSRENLTVATAIFCIVCFEALARGLDDVSNYLLQCTDVSVIRLLFHLCPSIIYCLCPCVFCIIKLVSIWIAFGLLGSISEWMWWKEVVPILVASMGQNKAGGETGQVQPYSVIHPSYFLSQSYPIYNYYGSWGWAKRLPLNEIIPYSVSTEGQKQVN